MEKNSLCVCAMWVVCGWCGWCVGGVYGVFVVWGVCMCMWGVCVYVGGVCVCGVPVGDVCMWCVWRGVCMWCVCVCLCG